MSKANSRRNQGLHKQLHDTDDMLSRLRQELIIPSNSKAGNNTKKSRN